MKDKKLKSKKNKKKKRKNAAALFIKQNEISFYIYILTVPRFKGGVTTI